MSDNYDQREAIHAATRDFPAAGDPRWVSTMPPAEVLQAARVIIEWAARNNPTPGAPWSIMGLGDVAAVRRQVLREVRAKIGEMK